MRLLFRSLRLPELEIVFDDVPGTITDHATRALLAGQHRLLCQFHASQAVAVATAETDQLPGHFTGWVIARIRRIGEHTGGTERQHALGLCRRQRVADVDEFARCACLQIFAEFAWLTTEQLGYRIDITWCIEIGRASGREIGCQYG